MPTNLTDEKPYYVIRQAVPADRCAFMTEYALFKATIHPTIRHNDPIAGTHREYGDPLMDYMLQILTPQIEAATGRSLWPTLSFYYTYRTGAQLAKHFDRSSCQFVASLCVGVDPEFTKTQKTWPLMINCQGKTEAVHLAVGDIMVFRGYETEHWREEFQGKWFVSAIFAYVDKQGPLSFQKYDQRKRLGLPHVGMLRWALGCAKARVKAMFR